MTPQDLITPKMLLTQIIMLLAFLLYSVILGPPQPKRPQIGMKSISVSVPVASDADQLEMLDQELLISERRPGTLSHKRFFRKEGQIWGHLENQWTAKLSLDARLQSIVERHFQNSRAALGGVAVMEVKTGRVIGLSEYINPDHAVTRRLKIKDDIHMSLKALAPSAGLFRVVTTAALLEKEINPLQSYCYTKFKYSLTQRHLSNRDPNACNTLNGAFVETDHSFLVYVSHQHLQTEDLKRMALNLGFDRKISFFGLPYELSTAYIPNSNVRRAYTALGFRNSKASPLHGAMIASAIATDGSLVRPRIVDEIVSSNGKMIEAPQLDPIAEGMSSASAGRMRRMMQSAINEDPTRKVFQNWPQSLRHMKVAGQASVKTYRKPFFVRYTWFIGYVPVKNPKWAISVMIANNEIWFVRALDIAHRVLKDYLEVIKKK